MVCVSSAIVFLLSCPDWVLTEAVSTGMMSRPPRALEFVASVDDSVVRSVLYGENMSLALSTDQKGAIAELAIAKAALARRIGVYRPLSDGERYDLIFDLGDRLDRVQCKWAPLHGDVVVVRMYSNRRTADGLRRRAYARGEIDALAAYCPDLDRCFYIPCERVSARLQLHLRISPSLNNQASGVNWAADFAFEGLQSARPGP